MSEPVCTIELTDPLGDHLRKKLVEALDRIIADPQSIHVGHSWVAEALKLVAEIRRPQLSEMERRLDALEKSLVSLGNAVTLIHNKLSFRMPQRTGLHAQGQAG